MAKSLKVEQVKAYRAEIYKQVDKYIDENPKNNTGQLKFLKGLLTGNVAVTVGKKIRKDKKFKDYLHEVILGDNDEVLSFFDQEKNLAELINIPCWEPPELYHGLRPKCELPPYLLIQKALNSMENAFMDYVGRPIAEKDDGTKGRDKKNDAYLELLFSIAFYEICLVEYGEKLYAMQQAEAGRPALDKETIGKRFPGIFSTDMDREMRLKDYHALLDEVMEAYDRIREIGMVNSFWTMHVVNLYAILRVIILIEYVKVGYAKKNNGKSDRNGDMRAVAEAKFWEKRAEEWGNCYLFSFINHTNPSQMVYGNKLSRIIQENVALHRIDSVSYVPEVAKWLYDDEANMLKYINAMRKHRKDPKSREVRRELWDTALELAMPVICVAKEIAKIR